MKGKGRDVALAVCLLVSFFKADFACVPISDVFFQVEDAGLDCCSLRGSKLSEWEKLALSVPRNTSAREWLRHYASTEHMAGTEGDLKMAEWTVEMMSSFGLQSEIVPMDVLLSYPMSRSLELITDSGEVEFHAPLTEKKLTMDPTSGTIYRNMTFLAYAASGKAETEFIYANYGRPEDFDVLQKAGVKIEERIVLVRYGMCFRGLKIMNAQARKAKAVIIFSDPKDDGFSLGKTYPEGPWRPPTSVQRGSAQFNSLCAGDPARAASGFNTKEVCGYEQEEVIPSIPAIPISHHDAEPFLKTLQGPAAPESFQGGLNFTYRLGPSKARARLSVNNKRFISKIWNVVTTIKGVQHGTPEDKPIILGNHRDAWVFGAADPNSGSSIMLEVGRTLGKLLQKGWKPKRTIVIASWSGEEFGLLGSTGWGEAMSQTLLKNAAVYINTDVGVSGQAFFASASPSLGKAILRAVSKVHDPVSGKSLSEVWNKRLGTLGSGSDYTVFLDNLGIASMDLRFGHPGEKQGGAYPYGTYHSTFDSFTWIETQADPMYQCHVAMAQLITLLAIDFASSSSLPIVLTDHGKALGAYVAHVEKLPGGETLDFQPLKKSIELYIEASSKSSFNDKVLIENERLFLDENGLPRRKWFKHILQAPGLFLGYEAKVFPAISEAIEIQNEEEAQNLIVRYSAIIREAALRLQLASTRNAN